MSEGVEPAAMPEGADPAAMPEGADPAAKRRHRRKTPQRSAHSRKLAGPVGRIASRWVAPTAVLIAAIALGLAVWALVRTPADNHAAPTPQQVADAKTRACAAYATVRRAVSLQTNADPGTDRVAVQAVAANARLAMTGGGSYLLAHLDPTTPPQLAESMRSLAGDLQDLAVNALAGAGNDDATQAVRLHDVEAKSMKITDLCK